MGLTWRFIFEPVSGLANWILDSGLGLEKYTWLSHKDTALSTLMIVDCWQWTPFVALILLAGMQSISTEISEAARLDRVRGVTYYTRIVLPLIRPVILVVILIRLVDSIRIFDLNFIMTKGGPGSSTLLASTHAHTIFTHGHLGLMAAYGFLILVLVNIVVGSLPQYPVPLGEGGARGGAKLMRSGAPCVRDQYAGGPRRGDVAHPGAVGGAHLGQAHQRHQLARTDFHRVRADGCALRGDLRSLQVRPRHLQQPGHGRPVDADRDGARTACGLRGVAHGNADGRHLGAQSSCPCASCPAW